MWYSWKHTYSLKLQFVCMINNIASHGNNILSIHIYYAGAKKGRAA